MISILNASWSFRLSDAKRVILVSHGSAARGVVDLVQARSEHLTDSGYSPLLHTLSHAMISRSGKAPRESRSPDCFNARAGADPYSCWRFNDMVQRGERRLSAFGIMPSLEAEYLLRSALISGRFWNTSDLCAESEEDESTIPHRQCISWVFWSSSTFNSVSILV